FKEFFPAKTRMPVEHQKHIDFLRGGFLQTPGRRCRKCSPLLRERDNGRLDPRTDLLVKAGGGFTVCDPSRIRPFPHLEVALRIAVDGRVQELQRNLRADHVDSSAGRRLQAIPEFRATSVSYRI